MTDKLPLNQILQGDCIEQMAALPPKSVDVVFADPPYNLQLNGELWRPNLTRVDAVDDDWDQFDDSAAYDKFTRSWLTAARRLLKPNGTIWVIGSYHNIFRIGAILQDLDYWFLNDVIWVKTNPMPNFRGMRFTNAHETLLWAQKHKGRKYTFNYRAMKALNDDKQMRSDWLLPICNGSERIRVDDIKAHSTQKPEALLYRVLLSSTNPGDVVLDPFFGSGTTGAVAKRLHRHWIGIEREDAYIQVAQERIEAIEPGEFKEENYVTEDPRNKPRVPFSYVVESGHLGIGQKLYYGKDTRKAAVVQADGNIEYNHERGSIHKMAKKLAGGPANGWEMWFTREGSTGAFKPINSLRETIRGEWKQAGK